MDSEKEKNEQKLLSPVEEYESEIKKKNYIRACEIAKENKLEEEKINYSKKMALKQMIKDYNNPYGAKKLALELELSKSELVMIINETLDDVKKEEEKNKLDIVLFDIEAMTHKNIKDIINKLLKELV